ncbi:MAG: helix-turn-helix domain-containing protein [Candidatus Eremiobacteraeota bacterium]|nr:helix-turn-helix domain-containing protein [Candidatus Eremiobacteraeota bacterium]
MPTSKPALDPDWLPKPAAAKLLGASARQLERRTAAGYIEKKLGERKPTERNAPVFYSRADIVAFKAGTPNTHAVAVPEAAEVSQDVSIRIKPAQTSLARIAPAGERDFMAAFDALAASLRTATAAPKPWLTLGEAAEYSGLPAAWLVARAREGAIRAVNVGTGAREFWRFNREGLEK